MGTIPEDRGFCHRRNKKPYEIYEELDITADGPRWMCSGWQSVGECQKNLFGAIQEKEKSIAIKMV